MQAKQEQKVLEKVEEGGGEGEEEDEETGWLHC